MKIDNFIKMGKYNNVLMKKICEEDAGQVIFECQFVFQFFTQKKEKQKVLLELRFDFAIFMDNILE